MRSAPFPARDRLESRWNSYRALRRRLGRGQGRGNFSYAMGCVTWHFSTLEVEATPSAVVAWTGKNGYCADERKQFESIKHLGQSTARQGNHDSRFYLD